MLLFMKVDTGIYNYNALMCEPYKVHGVNPILNPLVSVGDCC